MKISKLWLIAAVIIPTLASTAEIKQEVLENYAKHAQYLSVKISPNGKHLAATARNEEGTIQLTVLDIKNNKILSVTQGKGNESVSSFNWVNDNRLIMTMAREVGSLDMPLPTGEIFAMNADGSNQLILTGPRSDGGEYEFAQVLDMLPDEEDNILIYTRSMMSSEPYLDIYRMRANSGRKRSEGRIPLKAYRSTNVQVLVDRAGIARVAVGVDPEADNRVVILAREGANKEWYELASYDTDEGGFSPLLLNADATKVIGLSNSQTDTQAIATLDLKTKKETVLAEHPGTDLAPIMSITKGRAQELVGAAFEYDGIEAVFFDDIQDKRFVQIVQALMQSFPNHSVSISSATHDNSQAIIRVGSANLPTMFYLFNSQENKLLPLAPSTPWLDAKEMPETKLITYTSRDGLTIRALLTLPRGKKAENLPLILVPHGGPHGIRDSLAGIDGDAKVLAEHGYAVLQPNFRGSGGYGREFLELGHKNWGTTMINDMTDGVQHLIKEKIADADRVCVYGASYGGYAALQSAIREPDLYKCTVGFVGVYDLELMYEQGDISEAQAGRNYLDQVLPSTKEERQAQSPVHNTDKLKAPVFIIQGGRDVRVPKEHAFRLRDKLKEQDHPYEWMMKDGEGHGFYKPANNIERWERMLTFFDKYIGE
ncbi:MAG: peptidase S9 [Idiomarina sp.]|nr:MAG: peptidase S9 [Idiomarina sp.]